MAQLQLNDPILTCPFNPSHQILKSRMQFHLVKCEKNHAMAEMEVCPYNATHRMSVPERQHHLATCADRRVVEGHKFQVSDELAGQVVKPPYQVPQLPPSEEDWDAEIVESSYEPERYSMGRTVLRNLQGASKSQRKLFRIEERRRLMMLTEHEAKAAAEQGVSLAEQQQQREQHMPLPPLRLPRSQPAVVSLSNLGMGRGRVAAAPLEPNDYDKHFLHYVRRM